MIPPINVRKILGNENAEYNKLYCEILTPKSSII